MICAAPRRFHEWCWLAEQEPVLGRDGARNHLRSHTIAALLQPHGAHDIHRQRAIHPPRQPPGIIDVQIVAAGQHRHARPRGGRALEHQIGERSARMCGYHEVISEDGYGVERLCLENDPSIQSRPCRDEHVMKLAAGRRRRGVDDERLGR